MAFSGKRPQGESGGKRGHSNMSHRDYTGNIKIESNVARKRQDHQEVLEQLDEQD